MSYNIYFAAERGTVGVSDLQRLTQRSWPTRKKVLVGLVNSWFAQIWSRFEPGSQVSAWPRTVPGSGNAVTTSPWCWPRGKAERGHADGTNTSPPPATGRGSAGGGTVLWLTHSLSEADQWRHHVAPGAEPRLHTRRGGTGPRLHPLDLSDARWSAVLEALREDERWPACEGALT